MTGTFNRRAFADIAGREFLRARRFDRPLTVLALDIDHLKAINDCHGHATGDRVLTECTDRWVHLLRTASPPVAYPAGAGNATRDFAAKILAAPR